MNCSAQQNEVSSMKKRAVSIRILLLALAVLWCAAVVGCGRRTTPPGASVLYAQIPGTGTHFQFLKWQEGLAILFVDGIAGSHTTSGGGSTSDPVHHRTGQVKSKEGHGYDWELETTDGLTAKFKINDTNYEVGKGTVFVVHLNSELATVHQLDLDLSKLNFDQNDCLSFLQNNPDLIKLAEGKSDGN
jgi:hypothetical protein